MNRATASHEEDAVGSHQSYRDLNELKIVSYVSTEGLPEAIVGEKVDVDG